MEQADATAGRLPGGGGADVPLRGPIVRRNRVGPADRHPARPPLTTFRGAGDAVLALRGTITSGDVARMRAALSVLLRTGVRHLIVDVSAASPPPVALRGALREAAVELVGRGGWQLVDGLHGTPHELVGAFRAYRETRH